MPNDTDGAAGTYAKARSAFVVSCGRHRIEGHAGSAVQTTWMKAGGSAVLPAGTAVVLVHASNPWGFAHGQRVTENSVDLNRNFIGFASMPAPHAGSAELHPHLMLERRDAGTLGRGRDCPCLCGDGRDALLADAR